MTAELRLALVLEGGVSLAVWMGGVTHEINNLRATAPPTDPDAPAADPPCSPAVADAWQAIVSKSGIGPVIVDLVAGTSAGGLNGTILATTIARGQSVLPDMRTLWLTSGGLRPACLLGEALDTSRSLLNGKFFEEQVANTLESIVDSGTGHDVTLFVTATAIGNVGVSEGPIRSRDSRRVYRFRKRDDVEAPATEGWFERPWTSAGIDDFTTAGVTVTKPELVLAARASASFPVAFEPVPESLELARKSMTPVDHGGVYLMDGGVLDNAPFGPLLEALKQRPARLPFRRHVVFVSPGVGGGAQDFLKAPPHCLPTLASVLQAKNEPDARSDNDDMRRAQSAMSFSVGQPHVVLRDALEAGVERVQGLREAATSLFDVYAAGRLQAIEIWRQKHQVCPSGPKGLTFPPPALTPDNGLIPLNMGVGMGDWGLASCDRMLLWWGRMLSDPDEELTTQRQLALAAIADARAVILERHTAMLNVASTLTLQTMDTFLTQLAEWHSSQGIAQNLSILVESVASRVAEALKLDVRLGVDGLLSASTSVEVLAIAFSWGDDSSVDVPRFQLMQITPAQQPAPVLCGIDDWTQVPRFKLVGERWGHFGAFADADGRRNDWCWGRIDGATALAGMVLDLMDPVQQANPLTEVERQQLLNDLVHAILTEEGTPVEEFVKLTRKVMDTKPGELWSRLTCDVPTAIELRERLLRIIPENLPDSSPPFIKALLAPDNEPPPARTLRERLKLSAARRAGKFLRWRFGKVLDKYLRL